MAGLQDFAEGRLDIYKVKPQSLVIIPGWNVRDQSDPFVMSHIRAIADTIKTSGIQYIPALTVYMKDGNPVVTDGYCRTLAALLAISEGVDVPWLPVRGEERFADEADRTLSMLTRNSGLPLTPLQKADAVKRLLGFGWTDKQVAEKIGKSITHVQDLIHLLAAPQAVKEMITAGEVSASTATEVIRKEGEEKGTETLKAAVQTAKEAGKTRATPKDIPKAEKPAEAVDWHTWGPRMEKLLKYIRDDAKVTDVEQLKTQVGEFLKNMPQK